MNKVNQNQSFDEFILPIKNNKPIQSPYQFKWYSWEKYFALIAASFYAIQQIGFGVKTTRMSNEQQELNDPIKGVTIGYLGYLKDDSDGQWRQFSQNIYLLIIVAAIHLTISKWIKSLQISKKKQNIPLFLFNIVYGLALIIFLFHGDIVYWIFFTLMNYFIIYSTYNLKCFPIIIWAVNLSIIFLNDYYQGYQMRSIFPGYEFAKWIDESRQNTVSWYQTFNMTILRMISFGMDKHWSYFKIKQQSDIDHKRKCKECTKFINCLRLRYDENHPVENYDILTYFSYLLYVPLFITGPPLVFNAWYSQMIIPQKTQSFRQKVFYLARTVANYLGFTIWIHISHAFALSTIPENEVFWKDFQPIDLILLGVTTLFFIWFKFNTIWKVARCWALWDDVDAPENMNRCMFNNHNFERFWRSWHRGFNQWLIRYIFIPLGGSKTKIWNIWVIFTFVALWHDINLNLIFWAWGICIFMMPEVYVKNYFKKDKYKFLWKQLWWKYACITAASVWIYFMCIMNLIGFGMGYKILYAMFEKMDNFYGFCGIYIALFFQILETLAQFYIRELEQDDEKGI